MPGTAKTRRDAVKCWQGPRIAAIQHRRNENVPWGSMSSVQEARLMQERCPVSADHLDELSGLVFGNLCLRRTNRATRFFLSSRHVGHP